MLQSNDQTYSSKSLQRSTLYYFNYCPSMADVHFSVGMLKSSEALLLLCCSILGMHIFGCKFSLKTETGDTVPDRKNFDSLLWAIVTVFQVINTPVFGEACRQTYWHTFVHL